MNPIGERRCPVLGCRRNVVVTDSGIVYARCADHTREVTSGAFGHVVPFRARPNGRAAA